MKDVESKMLRPPPSYRQEWTHASIVLALVVAALFVLYAPTIRSMVATWWNSGTYNHGFLVVPISAYLLWRRREELAELTPRPTTWGLLLVLGLSVVWFVSSSANVLVLQQLSFVALTLASVLTLLGKKFVKAATFPLFFIFFAVPVDKK